ncbi:MAG TPA: aldehyde dehydrogenase family protein [Pseudonocardia sp.]|jgi:aldehyde dehydrogenase (NAD+)/betaine-aldehyde dehydrogenase|uniref:aldehyde dehydrogenase family protein n=1 Tax=Pseudonocardia sp. TaxID=60912 RepID=UPI002B4AE558|nr:aldehyde dehydrogenase family protein [Pseudonocardia sp.]HLU55375.1 aldehyde dehydrogenase family protein [Pseudonocardia sp.]
MTTDLRHWVPTARDLTIGGRAVPGAGPEIEAVNPATEEVTATVATAGLAQVDEAVAAARRAFPAWAAASPAERSAALHRLADLMERNSERLAAAIVNEVGTPIAFAEIMQVQLGIAHLRWQAEAALVDRTVDLGEWHDPVPTRSVVAYRPAGVVACITGYNYPLNLAIFKFGAALAAGCTAVLLPSPRTPLTTLWLGELFCEAEIPDGVLNVVLGGPEVGQHLTSHPLVDRVSFTGSDAVGAKIMEQAAAGLKGVTLELGGKSPNILLPGVDAAGLAKDIHLRWARNGGQGCAALARLLVHESLVDEFLGASKEAFTALKVGDPWDRSVNIGPMIRPDHRARVQSYIDGALVDGGEIVLSLDTPVPDRGYFVNPVVIGGLPHSARAVQEEIFGPVAVLVPFADTEEAIRLANDTAYGLAANVFTPDVEHGKAIAARLRSGTVWINGGGNMRPDAPFGGFGRSGVGREIGEWGIREYLEVQHVQWRV